ncbi:MAG: PD-(D/E)XK nuclease family transposase, partial [Prevotellaceae bacterium]|nr:PD-(D/E)XK nuclease family transposase [Prevotellaceae bacterium]
NGLVQQEIINKYPEYYSLQVKQDNNDELRQVYCVSIINDIAFPNLKDEFYHRYVPANIDHPENTIKGFETIFLELPKFRPSSVSDKKMMVLWLRFLTEINEQTKEIPAEMMENEFLCKAVGIVEQSAYTDAQRMAYDKFWDEIVSERTLMKGYFRQGHAEGRAEGRAEGFVEGDRARQISTAMSLKQMGVLSVSQIAKATGLTEDEISKL